MSIPVILDTDIGFDVDDVWALAFMLGCPELDVKLIVSDTGDTEYGARLIARLLDVAGRSDIPVGVGIPLDDNGRTHSAWLGEYQLDDYAGAVHTDGVGAMCTAIVDSPEPVTLISIGPVPNIAAALAREPAIADNARFVGMHGSLRRGYLGAPKPMREYNVKKFPVACQQVFTAPWERTITPLDTCGTVVLDGEHFTRVRTSNAGAFGGAAEHHAFTRVRTSNAPLAKAVMDNHFGWFQAVADWPVISDMDPSTQSSLLYDTVAVYLAFAEDLLEMETLPVLVTDDGKTLIDDRGAPTRCATGWRDYPAFQHLVAERLA